MLDLTRRTFLKLNAFGMTWLGLRYTIGRKSHKEQKLPVHKFQYPINFPTYFPKGQPLYGCMTKFSRRIFLPLINK